MPALDAVMALRVALCGCFGEHKPQSCTFFSFVTLHICDAARWLRRLLSSPSFCSLRFHCNLLQLKVAIPPRSLLLSCSRICAVLVKALEHEGGGRDSPGYAGRAGRDGLKPQAPTRLLFSWWLKVLQAGSSLRKVARSLEANGLVPIVEPEVTLGEGEYSIERTAYISEKVNSHVFRLLNEYNVTLEGILLKPNMILPGLDVPTPAPAEVARYTVRTKLRSVPGAVPGIHFLSGGMIEVEATLNLQALQSFGPTPWSLTFSYGRALQSSTLKTWAGKEEKWDVAQERLVALAKTNSEALLGKYKGPHPSLGGERILQALRLGGVGK